jgi:hypothetical protein
MELAGIAFPLGRMTMHRTRFVFGFAALFLGAGIVVTAEQGHGSAAKPQPAPKSVKPAATMQPKTMQPATAPKAMKPAPAPKAMKPAPAKTMKPVSSPTSATTAAPKPVKAPKATSSAPVKLAKTEKGSTTRTTAKTATTSAVTTATPTTTVSLTPVQQKLQKNTNLASKLSSRLPAGTDLMTAAAGFRNLGQFVAAVNVSNNLDIPFAQLKTMMVTENKSLGQAIQALKPVASATVEAQHAEYDARGMIAASEQQPQTVSPVSTTTAKSKTTTKKSTQ